MFHRYEISMASISIFSTFKTCFVIVAINSPDPPHILQRASRLWELGKKLNPPPFQILRFEIGLDLHNIKRQEMEPVGSSAMMMICKALVIYNLWTLCWYLNLRCDFHFLNSWTYRQELSTVYPHTNIYMQLHAVYPYAFFVFVYVFHHMKNIFVWKSKLHNMIICLTVLPLGRAQLIAT